MKIEREILGIDVTIDFDEDGFIEEITVEDKYYEIYTQNWKDFFNQAQELVNQYFESEREEAQDREFERRRGN